MNFLASKVPWSPHLRPFSCLFYEAIKWLTIFFLSFLPLFYRRMSSIFLPLIMLPMVNAETIAAKRKEKQKVLLEKKEV